MTFSSDFSNSSFQNYLTYLYVMCLILYIYVMLCEHVSKFYVGSNHFSVTNSLVGKHRNVYHFSVKISMAAMLERQDVDHFSVKILKLSNFTESLTSPLFIYNVTKTIALKTFFTAKERISIFWGCSLFFLIKFLFH